jgi:glycosyltransferase involved in cell wall biosynthesis
MRILHVTESFASGVLSFIDDVTRAQAAEGLEPHVLYAVRPDSPTRGDIEARFAPGVTLHGAIDGKPGLGTQAALARAARRLVREEHFDAIHLHSSRAGVVGRLALWPARRRLFYSPHGFAFLRLNTSAVSRRLTRTIERTLARVGSLVVTSDSEMHIARTELRAKSVYYLRSGVPANSIIPRRLPDNARPRVIMIARMVYQKAPWRFARIATELAELADFVWVGGDASGTERWIGDAPVKVIEWVTPSDLAALVDSADILLFPTLWEGFSLSLVQAQAAGLPAVTSDVVGNRDAVLDGVTGYVCATEEEMIQATRRLIESEPLRQTMSEAAQLRVRAQFVNDGMGRDTRDIYRHDVFTARASEPSSPSVTL